MKEPIYNKLPVEYDLYENLIESMKYEELKNKNYLKNSKYAMNNSGSNQSQSQDGSYSELPIKNKRLSFGNTNYNSGNEYLQKQRKNSKNTDMLKKSNFVSNKKYK